MGVAETGPEFGGVVAAGSLGLVVTAVMLAGLGAVRGLPETVGADVIASRTTA
jgi:hypothetical protein